MSAGSIDSNIRVCAGVCMCVCVYGHYNQYFTQEVEQLWPVCLSSFCVLSHALKGGWFESQTEPRDQITVPSPGQGAFSRQPIDVSLSHMDIPLSLSPQ